MPLLNKLGIMINVGTKYVTTLALLSAIKFAKIPILVIDCESRDGSFDHFTDLQKTTDFYLMKMPLNKHGITLDSVFKDVNADYVYLIDSDTEMINSDIINFIDKYIERNNVFGAGFVHEAGWLKDESLIRGFKFGYYYERMWVPFTCLNVSKVREALVAKRSFLNKNILNDFYPLQLISKALIARNLIPGLKNLKLSLLNFFKKPVNGQYPSYVVYDTGADIYDFLKFDKEYDFIGIPAKYHEDSILHFHGITRRILDPKDKNTHELSDYDLILQKLQTVYNIEL